MNRVVALPALALLAGCVAAPPLASLESATPVFSPEHFFAGRTDGTGSLRIAFAGRNALRVEGHGRVEPDGTLVIDQRIEQDGKRPAIRQWRMRSDRPGHWTGTLTDADGPVSADAQGNCFHIRYRMKSGGLSVEQWLYLQPDARTVRNRMTLRKWGVPVAGLEETIVKRAE